MKLRLWINQGLEITLWSMGVAGAYGVFSPLSRSGASFRDLTASLSLYILMGGAVLIPLMSLMVFQSYLPAYLALGSLRRDALWGIQVMRLIPAAGTVVLAALVGLLVSADSLLQFLPAAFFLLLMLGALGGITASICQRFPRFGKVLSVLVMVILFGFMGFVGGMLGSGGRIPSLHTLELPQFLTLISAAAALTLLAVDIVLLKRILRRYEVKL